jgi:hypothetical protein
MEKTNSKQCCNCVACMRETELCPLNENYKEDAYLEIEARLKANKEQRKLLKDTN